MLVNNKSYNSFLNNVETFKGSLVYGPDKGQVRNRANQIIKAIKTNSPSDVVKVSLEDLENNKFIDLINQTNMFSNKLIINLDLDLVPSINLDLSF